MIEYIDKKKIFILEFLINENKNYNNINTKIYILLFLIVSKNLQNLVLDNYIKKTMENNTLNT